MLSSPQHSVPSLHVCVCACVWASMCTCVCVYKWVWRPNVCLPQALSISSSETVSLEHGVYELNQTSWPVSSRDLPLPSPCIRDTWRHTWLLFGFWEATQLFTVMQQALCKLNHFPSPFIPRQSRKVPEHYLNVFLKPPLKVWAALCVLKAAFISDSTKLFQPLSSV